jgi:hypothetical protein
MISMTNRWADVALQQTGLQYGREAPDRDSLKGREAAGRARS